MDYSVGIEYVVSARILAGVRARTGMDALSNGSGAGGFTGGGIFRPGAGAIVSRSRKRNDVGRAMPMTGWDDASNNSGAVPGREAERARGGIICVSTFWDVADTPDAGNDARDLVPFTVPDVQELGGAFPTYPHFP